MERLWLRRRLLFSVTLCALVILLAVMISRPWNAASRNATSHLVSPTAPKSTATWQPTYSIVPRLPNQTTFHPGDKLNYIWLSQRDPAPRSYAPGAITCTFALYGPYATEAAANRASDTDLSKLTPAVAAPPLTLNRWTKQSWSETMTLPANLASGYYVLVARVVESDAGGVGSTTRVTDIYIIG